MLGRTRGAGTPLMGSLSVLLVDIAFFDYILNLSLYFHCS